MTTNYQLKPFVVNFNDLLYLLEQVTFVPLFDAEGNALIAFNGTADAYDSHGVLVWNAATQSGSYNGTALSTNPASPDYFQTVLGQGFPSTTSSIGIRDVTGLHNNLFATQQFWGTVDVPFLRQIAVDYSNYIHSQTNGFYATDNNGFATDLDPYTAGDQNLTTVGANYATSVSGGVVTQSNVIDYTPRMISRTITTGGVNLLLDANGHYLNWDPVRYTTDLVYAARIDDSGVDIATLIEGAKIVAPAAVTDAGGVALVWSEAQYTASAIYTATLSVYAHLSVTGQLLGSSDGGTTFHAALAQGDTLYYQKANGTLVQVPGQGPFDAALYDYAATIDGAGVDVATLADGDAIYQPGGGYGLVGQLGHVDFQDPTSGEIFIGSENPGVAPVNSWFGIFGQFLDHGLDLIGKGGQGTTIRIALAADDPLYGAIGPDGQPVTSITINRATVDTSQDGTAQYANHTSPQIDQSQTYGSVDQITQLLRKWVSTDNDVSYHAGLELFDGQQLATTWTRKWPDGTTAEVYDTLPTLTELRDHVLDTNRVALTWDDVANYRNRSADGTTLSGGDSGHALILDMNTRFDASHLDSTLQVGKTGDTVQSLVADAIATLDGSLPPGMTFQRSLSGGIELIVTGGAGGPYTPDGTYTGASALVAAGWLDPASFGIMSPPGSAANAAVGEILMAAVGDHYVAGDGRVNENFGLTSIHHVFHEEHNFQVENLKSWIYQHDTANSPLTHDGLHKWQDVTAFQDDFGNYMFNDTGVTEVTPGVFKANKDNIAWKADEMFNATKLIVEMEYQHAAVDQYARTVTPRIQEFVGYSSGVDPSISLEYSQVAFRFGHSTIRETIDTMDPSGWYKGAVTKYALELAFLNPATFAEHGPAAVTLGLTRQQMNEVDELITPALNQGLLGQPLDLAAINIARGRDLGIPTLNDFREGISLARYTSWADFGANMIHPESLVSFIAAYSFDGDVAAATAAMQNAAFMNNNTGAPAGADGFNNIDSWIGGLAEAHVPGGLLGETFDAVFVAQIQALMDGDRFYYLYRLFGTNLHEEVNNGQFKDIVERNTGLEHLNGSIFAYADKYYDFTRDADLIAADVTGDFADHAYASLTAEGTGKGIFSDGGDSTAFNGTDISVMAADGIRAGVTLNLINDLRVNATPDQVHTVEGTPTDGADSHEVIVATDNRDYIHARGGDDTVYGEGGDDYIFADGGVDRLYGGDGDDLLDTGEGPDLADGGAGKDIIYGRGSGSEVGGFDQLVGGSGNDLIIGGEGIDKLSGGQGDDIIYGDGLTNPEMGNTDAFTHGGDGNDYIDTGASGDLLFGEEGDDYMVGGIDQDLMQGGQGDDILRPGGPSQASGTVGGPDEVVGDNGQADELGFDLIDLSDWAGNAPGTTIDFDTQQNPLVAIDQTSPFPAWFQIEGAIGTQNGDTFLGSNALDAAGLANPFGGSNWLIGGTGSDTFTGNGGNDVIVGGSIRLDTLIGNYADADTAQNAALGSTQWLADAMQSGGTGTGYADNTQEAYSGASNRALGDLSGGILTAAGFDLHFTEMLRSRMFKDVVLGDGGEDAANTDTAAFVGNHDDYTIVALNAAGGVVNQPWLPANLGQVFALKITDNVGDRTLADGTVLPSDGTDLIIGVENFRFADGDFALANLFLKPPALDLHAFNPLGNYRDQFTDQQINNSNGTLDWSVENWVEAGDGANDIGNGQIQMDNGGGSSNVLRFAGGNGAAFNGASIERIVDLSTAGSHVTLAFDISKSGGGSALGATENVKVFIAEDGVNFTLHDTITSASANGTHTVTIATPAAGFSQNAVIRIEATAMGTNKFVNVDNVNIALFNAANDGNDFTAAFTEAGAGNPGSGSVAIASFPSITDGDNVTLASAKVVLTNAKAGDVLIENGIGGDGISGAIDNSVAGQITLTLTGNATLAAYQAAISAVRFNNTSNTPDTTARTINVTVNDGLSDSNIAHATVTVTAVDDQAVLNNDTIITNLGNTQFSVADWALTANDTDSNAAAIAIDGVNGANGLANGSPTHAGQTLRSRIATRMAAHSVTMATAGIRTNSRATVTLQQQAGNTLSGGNNNNSQIFVGNSSANTFNATGGNDFIFAGADNDTLNGGTGNDYLDGGTNAAAGDTAVFTAGVGTATFALSNGNVQVVSRTAAEGTDTLVSIESPLRRRHLLPIPEDRYGADNTLTASSAPELFLGFDGTDTVAYSGNTAINANLATGLSSDQWRPLLFDREPDRRQ